MKLSSELNEVSRETSERLAVLVELLLRWNKRLNLVGAADEHTIWQRHVADSLQLAPLMWPPPARAIDLGSGAGFPGLVLAVATGVPFDLIEADTRKAAFLREAARFTGAPVRVHPTRAETADVPPAPLLTARAVAPLTKLLSLAAPLVSAGGVCLFLKGKTAAAELTQTTAQWHMHVDCIPSRTEPQACILRICDLSRVAPAA